MITDLRLGFRLFLRRPGLALAAVLSLALGIGANTAIFSVLHHVALKPLPYEDPDRLMIVWETSAENPERWVAPANFVDWRRDTRSFASLAAFDTFSPTLTGLGEAERLSALGASGTFFTTLGASAAVGRPLLPEDDAPGAADVAVLADGFWQRAFGASTDVLGRALSLDGRTYTIVGVMPPTFSAPLFPSVDVFLSGDRGVPRTFPFGGDLTAVRDSHIIFVLGRLAPGVSPSAAQQEFTALMTTLAARHPDTNAGLGANVKPLHDEIVGEVGSAVTLLQLAVGMMLLIACANVAHLLLGQAAARQQEMSTRSALGAGRRRLTRQLLAETLVIAVPGGAIGLLIAWWSLALLVAAAPDGVPRLHEIRIDPAVLGFTSAVTLLTVALFGLGPAVQLARTSGIAVASTRVAGGRGVRRWHHGLVVGELVLAQVLLAGAGLLLASFVASQRVPLGFEMDGRVAADLSLAPERYLRPIANASFTIDPSAKLAFVEAVLARVRQAPGVRAASASFTSPLTGAPNRGLSIEGRPPAPAGQGDNADFQLVTPDYFRALGGVVVRGRGLTERDDVNAPRVAVVNQAFVDRYFRNEEAIGRRIQFGERDLHEIVGVVGDMRYRRVESAADPTFYVPITQNRERWPFLSFTVWSDRDPALAAGLLRDAIRSADPAQAITRIRTFDEILATSLASRRFNTLLVLAFAGAALLLAAVGTYGVMAYSVSVRTRELGLRAALGATPAELQQLLLGQGARLVGMAVAIGIGAALAAAGVLSGLLYGIAPRDPATLTIVAGVLAAVALAATWLPARRAVRIDPAVALRDA
jgi:putative ABC transport system permease protein